VAEAQAAGGTAVFVDAEHAFDAAYARRLGVRCDELVVSQPDHGEQAFNIMDDLIRSGAVDVVVVDSVSALTPRSEVDGEIGAPAIGAQARLMSQALRRVAGNASKSGVTVIFINQLRYKVGVIYGSPETTSGGQALKFYASCRLDIRAREKILEPGKAEPVGMRVRVKVVKNKVAAPFEVAEFDILFGEGIHALGCVLDAAEATGVVARRVRSFVRCRFLFFVFCFEKDGGEARAGPTSIVATSPSTPHTQLPLPPDQIKTQTKNEQGAYYYLGEQRLGQGRERALAALREDSALRAAVEARVRESMAAAREDRDNRPTQGEVRDAAAAREEEGGQPEEDEDDDDEATRLFEREQQQQHEDEQHAAILEHDTGAGQELDASALAVAVGARDA